MICMKKIISFAVLFVSLAYFQTALAHERQVFRIENKDYLFIVGSLNEPAYVDDKSGVDLRVLAADPSDPGNSSSVNAKPIEGLDKTLKVEVSAGDKKKIFPLAAAYKNPGTYTAAFYPTVHTTFSYRFFGTINDTPVDMTFTCAAPATATPEDKTVVSVSQGVNRILKAGAFGCPLEKTDAGFPDSSASIRDLSVKTAPSRNNPWYMGVSLVALVFSVAAIFKSRKN